jgi:hypothetical protein
MPKILFQDKDGQTFIIGLRGGYSHIRSQKKLKEILDNSITSGYQQHHNLQEALRKKSYMDVMRYFGMLSTSKRLEKTK